MEIGWKSKTDRQVELIEDQEKKRKLRNCFIFETFFEIQQFAFSKKNWKETIFEYFEFFGKFFS